MTTTNVDPETIHQLGLKEVARIEAEQLNVAKQLGCTTVWIAEMVRSGDIPKSCLVPGTGNGRPWKFYRAAIDRWLASR